MTVIGNLWHACQRLHAAPSLMASKPSPQFCSACVHASQQPTDLRVSIQQLYNNIVFYFSSAWYWNPTIMTYKLGLWCSVMGEIGCYSLFSKLLIDLRKMWIHLCQNISHKVWHPRGRVSHSTAGSVFSSQEGVTLVKTSFQWIFYQTSSRAQIFICIILNLKGTKSHFLFFFSLKKEKGSYVLMLRYRKATY